MRAKWVNICSTSVKVRYLGRGKCEVLAPVIINMVSGVTQGLQQGAVWQSQGDRVQSGAAEGAQTSGAELVAWTVPSQGSSSVVSVMGWFSFAPFPTPVPPSVPASL